jgi:hypothetical protein
MNTLFNFYVRTSTHNKFYFFKSNIMKTSVCVQNISTKLYNGLCSNGLASLMTAMLLSDLPLESRRYIYV